MSIIDQLNRLHERYPPATLMLLFITIIVFTVAFAPGENAVPVAKDAVEVIPAGPQLFKGHAAHTLHRVDGEVVYGATFRGALLDAGIPGCAADSIQKHFAAAGFNFSKCKPGQKFTAQCDSSGQLKAFRYTVNRLNSYWILPDSNNTLVTSTFETPTTRELILVEGVIESSVWNAMQEMGEKPELVVAYEEVLGYDMDFIFDPRKGDVFSVLVERIMLDGDIVAYGNIIKAEYEGDITGTMKGY
jgi:hypothetical protein